MKSLKYLYTIALLASGMTLFAENEIEVSGQQDSKQSTELVPASAVRNSDSIFPQEYNEYGLQAVPGYFLKMADDKQVLRLSGEYKKGLNLGTHYLVALFNHDSEKAVRSLAQLPVDAQCEMLLCAGKEFIRDYLTAITENRTKWECVKKARSNSWSEWKETERTPMPNASEDCTTQDSSNESTTIEKKEGTVFNLPIWIKDLNRYERVSREDCNIAILATLDMLFRYAESVNHISSTPEERVELMAEYIAEIFNTLWVDEESDDNKDRPELQYILVTNAWNKTWNLGKNPQRKISDEDCKQFKGKVWDDSKAWTNNNCDQPFEMKLGSTLQLNYLHALIRELDNANRIPLMARINQKGGLNKVLNEEICLKAEEEYFPFVEEELLEKMFELCEQHIYSDEAIAALQEASTYLQIGTGNEIIE